MGLAREVFRLIKDGYPVSLLFCLIWVYGLILFWYRRPTRRMQPSQLSPRATLCINTFLRVFASAYVVQLVILLTDLKSRTILWAAIDGTPLLSNALVFGLLIRNGPVTERAPYLTFPIVWAVSLLFEPCLFVNYVVDLTVSAYPPSLYRVVAVTCLGLRACCICAAGLVLFKQCLTDARPPSTDEERQGLLTSCTTFRSADSTGVSQPASNGRLQDSTKWLSRLGEWSVCAPHSRLPNSHDHRLC